MGFWLRVLESGTQNYWTCPHCQQKIELTGECLYGECIGLRSDEVCPCSTSDQSRIAYHRDDHCPANRRR
jgi:hypothetical protein